MNIKNISLSICLIAISGLVFSPSFALAEENSAFGNFLSDMGSDASKFGADLLNDLDTLVEDGKKMYDESGVGDTVDGWIDDGKKAYDNSGIGEAVDGWIDDGKKMYDESGVDETVNDALQKSKEFFGFGDEEKSESESQKADDNTNNQPVEL